MNWRVNVNNVRKLTRQRAVKSTTLVVARQQVTHLLVQQGRCLINADRTNQRYLRPVSVSG